MRLLPRSHSFDFMKIMRYSQKRRQKLVCPDPNRRVRKETRTDMESATVETLETAQDLAKIIIFDASKSTKRHFSTTMLVTPADSPFRQPQPQPWRRVLRTTFLQLAASLRSRDGCEALFKVRHHEKINIIESTAGDLYMH